MTTVDEAVEHLEALVRSDDRVVVRVRFSTGKVTQLADGGMSPADAIVSLRAISNLPILDEYGITIANVYIKRID